jgi:haloacid dehalogenase-like hydrolase
MATGKQLKAAILARRAAKGPRKKRARTEPRQYTVADLERARDRVAAAERRIDNDRCPNAAAVHRAENLDIADWIETKPARDAGFDQSPPCFLSDISGWRDGALYPLAGRRRTPRPPARPLSPTSRAREQPERQSRRQQTDPHPPPACGAEVWLFSGHDWLVGHSDKPYVALEERTVGFPPTIVEDFGAALDTTVKIVGVSADFELLARCERDAHASLIDQASVVRSQPYYLDITHPFANKGVALSEIANLLAVPLAEVAVIGDGGNDVAMFERSS